MATTKRLERNTIYSIVSARTAKGALAANKLVTIDGVTDDEGFTVKQIGALTDRPFGVTGDDTWADGVKNASIFETGILPIVCGDAAVAANVEVFNDAGGRVSAVQGAGAFLVGITRSKTAALNELVSVKLAIV
jgi:hypothetical protein